MTMFFRALFLLVSLTFAFAAAAQDLPDYSEKPANELKLLSERGDAHATYTLGYNLVVALGDDLTLREDADWPRALILLNRAHQDNHPYAASMLSSYFRGHFGHDENITASDKILLESAQNGSALSKLNYAQQYFKSEDITKRSRAREYLRDAAYNPLTQNAAFPLFVEISYRSFGEEVNYAVAQQRAIECTKALPENSYCPYILGRDFKNGWGGKEDVVLSAVYYEESAKNGDERAMWYTGMNYLNGSGVRKSETIAFKWVEKSAQAEYVNGLISYAVMNATGEGTEVDFNAAFYAYEQAARLGSLHALRGIGVMYMLGQGREVDLEMAAAALILAADGEEENAVKILKLEFDISTQDDLVRLRSSVAPQIKVLQSSYGLSD